MEQLPTIKAIGSGGAGGWVRHALATTPGQAKRILKSGYRAGGGGLPGAYKALRTFLGYEGTNVAFGREGLGLLRRQARVLGKPMEELMPRALSMRRAGVFGTGAALALGTSMATGYSMWDMAQAAGGAYLGRRFAGRMGLGKLGTGMAMGAGGFGLQAMDTGEIAGTSAGYWGARGLQALGGRKGGRILGRFGTGGGVGRFVGGAIGYGLGSML